MIKCIDRMEVDFIVQEDKGIVVAKVRNPSELAKDLHTTDFGSGINGLWLFNDFIEDDIALVRGIAKCSDEDIFDIVIGKRIALNKLKKKLMKIFLHDIKINLKDWHNVHLVLLNTMFNCNNHIDKIDERIKRTYEKIQSR